MVTCGRDGTRCTAIRQVRPFPLRSLPHGHQRFGVEYERLDRMGPCCVEETVRHPDGAWDLPDGNPNDAPFRTHVLDWTNPNAILTNPSFLVVPSPASTSPRFPDRDALLASFSDPATSLSGRVSKNRVAPPRPHFDVHLRLSPPTHALLRPRRWPWRCPRRS